MKRHLRSWGKLANARRPEQIDARRPAAARQLRLSLGLRYNAPAVHLQLALLHAGTGSWAQASSAVRRALS